LRDRNNSAILAEQTAAISAGDSYDKLTRNIKEMRGDFVKLSLSQRAPAEKGSGGNTKSFGPFNIEIQNNVNTPALIGAPPVYQGGPSWPEHNNTVDALRREIADLKWENRELQRDLRDAQNSTIKDVINQVLPAIMPEQKKAAEISGAGVPVIFEDQQTAQHVFNLSQRPKFNEVVKNLDAKGLIGWAVVLNNLEIEANAIN
jgi:hypothetical protein